MNELRIIKINKVYRVQERKRFLLWRYWETFVDYSEAPMNFLSAQEAQDFLDDVARNRKERKKHNKVIEVISKDSHPELFL